MFAYCANSPTKYRDAQGAAFETIFDIISLGASIAEVIANPSDTWAWIGLALDVVDVAVPIVSGLGELSDAISISHKAANTLDAVDDSHDIRVVINNFGGEHKNDFQIKTSEALDAWDEFLGPGQTSYNRFTGNNDPNRIFSSDGSRAIRLDNHEMDSLGTKKAHFHYEFWELDILSNTVYVTNTLQRLR